MAAAETDEQRKQELLVMSENCATVPENSPQTFWQAIQFVWFIHITLWIESNGHANSFPVFDRLINPLYIKDLQDGKVTEREALDILECFFIKNTDILKLRNAFFSESWAGYPVWQNMIIGGIGADGKDACNEATMLLLKANEEVQTLTADHVFALSQAHVRGSIRQGHFHDTERIGYASLFQRPSLYPSRSGKE